MSPDQPPIFSASDRIKHLNNIDKDVAKLLQSAGLAVKALTKPMAIAPAESLSSQPVPIEQQRESFTAATSQYFTLLSLVDVNLRRQIYALEEAGVLPAEAVTKEPPTSMAVPLAAQANPPNASSSRTAGGNKGVITGGGLGNLDVGWLNSRNDNVGKEMKAELWEEAERFVSKLEERKSGADRELDFLKGDGEK
ncbi:hypothetical protein HO133_004571 [Letharia lupina]|uniref:Mediator of RNA polymerase II transcription subunit 11 n=1 Tax=Letharia lupina TaxID=560253 RepID=A0A8H6FKJ6_9LECA|nr:uncharacterized protein HO133_004571 [Letharia lupina]KAF6230231.1 hypothetical protein HO133_004571 [Letharia lupina]